MSSEYCDLLTKKEVGFELGLKDKHNVDQYEKAFLGMENAGG